MDILPLGPGFAAELRGVTLADVAADDAAYQAVRAAFEQHSVIVLRDQDVTDEAQIAFSRRFGPLEVTPGGDGRGRHQPRDPHDHRQGRQGRAGRRSAGAAQQSQSALARRLDLQKHAGAGFGAVGTDHAGARRRNRICFNASRLGAASSGDTKESRKFIRLARLRALARQDRVQHRRRIRASGAAAAMLAHGVEESGERAQRALHRFARLRDRRHGAKRGAEHDRRADRGGNRTGIELPASFGAKATSSCGTTAPRCIAAGRGRRTRRGPWCARPFRRPTPTACRACARPPGRRRNRA